MSTLLTIVLFITFSKLVQCANILALMTVASRSHHIWNSVLLNTLADRGHQITYFSPDKDEKPHPNIRYLTIDNVYEYFIGKFDSEGMAGQYSSREVMQQVNGWGTLNTEAMMMSKAVDKLVDIAKHESFDLVIFDHAINEGILGITKFLNETPIVAITAFAAAALPSNAIVGNPASLAIWSNAYLQYPAEMTFVQRIENVLTYFYYFVERRFVYLPNQQRLGKEKFGDFDLAAILNRINLVLVNSHFSFDPPIPAVPAFVQVGGLHVLPAQPLPQDIKKFLDEAKSGAVLFSLGTNVNTAELSRKKLQIFINAMKKIAPVRVLWKFEKESDLDISDNVMTRKWIPQSDILGHPNIKAFITHSGLLSTHEALYHSKPMVGVPFFTDQHINIHRCVREGYGVKVDINTMTEDSLAAAIREVLRNPKYKQRVSEVSQIFRDQLETPLERAVYWIEYVIRYKGAPHLQSPSLKLSWLQNELLDVAVVLLGATAAIAFLLFYTLSCVKHLVTSKPIKTKSS